MRSTPIAKAGRRDSGGFRMLLGMPNEPLSSRQRPTIDWTDDEIKARLREMYSSGNYMRSPADYQRELERRSMRGTPGSVPLQAS